jgi:methionyl-tRNA synthetase
MSKFFVTTPIYYVNDAPHIGHAYTTILADVLSRYHRAAGDEVLFLTGLDEHGQKVMQAAQKRGFLPQAHCDDLAPRFLICGKPWISNMMILSVPPRNVIRKIVQLALQKVYDNGDIYTDEYEGWYSVAEERFITDTEYESGQFRDVKKAQGKELFL